jgi:RNA polymerase sigma factor (sigma-70 family)
MTSRLTGPVGGGSSETWEFLTERVHRVLEIVAGLVRKRYSPSGVGNDLASLDEALSWAENYLRTQGPGLPRHDEVDGPQVAGDLLLEVVDLRSRLVATVMASRHEMMQRVDQSLQRLRSVGTVEDFARELPKEIVGLGYVRSLFSWADGLHWVAQSAHSVQGEEEGRRLVEAGRQRPYRDLRDLFEYEMLRERRPILRQGIRKSRQVHPELMRITESDSYVASPLIAGGAVVGFASLDVNATTGSVDGFDRDLVGIHTSGAGIILERLRLDQLPSVPPGRIDSEVQESSSEGLAARVGEALKQLTSREREILHLVAEGLTNAEIGRELTITEGTAKTHVRNVLRKLDVSNRTQAAALYRRERGE